MTVLRHASSSLRRALTTSAFRDSFSLQSQHVASPILTAGQARSSTLHGLRNQRVWSCTSKACFASSSEGTEVTSTVPNAVQLCDAREPIMQKAAANRVRLLAEIDHTLKDLVGAGACPKLLGMLKPDIDAGVAQAVLAAIKEISRLPEGREALVQAGALEILNTAVQQQWLPQQEQTYAEARKIRDWLSR